MPSGAPALASTIAQASRIERKGAEMMEEMETGEERGGGKGAHLIREDDSAMTWPSALNALSLEPSQAALAAALPGPAHRTKIASTLKSNRQLKATQRKAPNQIDPVRWLKEYARC